MGYPKRLFIDDNSTINGRKQNRVFQRKDSIGAIDIRQYIEDVVNNSPNISITTPTASNLFTDNLTLNSIRFHNLNNNSMIFSNAETFSIGGDPSGGLIEFSLAGGGASYNLSISQARVQLLFNDTVNLNGFTFDATGATLNGGGNTILTNLPTYADDAAAGIGGLATDSLYKTATGELRIKL
jgi:hypothetical protein